MDKISFTIFIPDGKKFHLTPNWIFLILLIITIGFYYFPSPGDYKSYVLIGSIAIIFCFWVLANWTYKPLNGVLAGEIIFEKDTIIINQKPFKLVEINGLDFGINDFYGKEEPGRIRADLSPMLLQGVNNYVTFTDNAQELYVVYFKLEKVDSVKSMMPFISQAIKDNKMQFKQAIDSFGIENVPIN